MSRCSFQCPDSGLVVIVSMDAVGRAYVSGDEADWIDMEADEETKQATREWIETAQRRVKGRRGFDDVALALKGLHVEIDSLYPLTWER